MKKSISITSPIQNRVISTLKNKDRARYSELQAKGEPNDLFNYHLQFLVKKGIVGKDERGYFLSELGLRIVADANTVELGDHLFKVNVIMVVSRKKQERNTDFESTSQIQSFVWENRCSWRRCS